MHLGIEDFCGHQMEALYLGDCVFLEKESAGTPYGNFEKGHIEYANSLLKKM